MSRAAKLPTILVFIGVGLLSACQSTPDYTDTWPILDKAFELIQNDLKSGVLVVAIPKGVKVVDPKKELEETAKEIDDNLREARKTISVAQGRKK